MYSPADLPSSWRAAPAKKRRLSAENGISSRDAIRGLTTFSDSSCASSFACSSMTSASLCRSSERSFGVLSSQSGSAAFAASTARSTSSAEQFGTSAITSPVAGAITSIVSPEALSAQPPPMNAWYDVFVALIWSLLLLRDDRCRRATTEDSCVAHQPLCERDRDHRQDDHRECDGIHDRQLLAEPDVAEDQQRKRVLRPRGEKRDDHLVEGQCERKQAAGDEGRREYRPDDEAERLPAVGAQVGRGLEERGRRATQAREHVVVDDHDAEGRMADHDRPERQVDVVEREERVQRHPSDDPGQRDREHEQERDRLAAEETEAGDCERRGGAEHDRGSSREQRTPHREPDRAPNLLGVPGGLEPVRREARDRPALNVRAVERVDHDQRERDPQERDHEGSPDPETDAGRALLHLHRLERA